MSVKSYRDLIVWQRAIQLVKEIYVITADFPREETYGLVSQLRRAAVSVPSNIAEGQARRTTGELLNFLSQAEGSLAEVDTQLTVSIELGFVGAHRVANALDQVSQCQRMLKAMSTRLMAGH